MKVSWSPILLALSGCIAQASPDADTHTAPQLEEHHPVVANLVATLLRYQHYESRSLDDEMSRAWLEEYIETLDFNRMVFLASDIAEFRRWETTLDDDITSHHPTLEAATFIYARYQERLSERIAAAQRTLDAPIDLTTDRTWQIDRSEAPWPATAAEADELWELRVIEQVLLGDLQGTDRAERIALLKRRYARRLTDELSAEGSDVLEYYLSSLTRNYDPHSVYFKPATSDDFNIDISNSVEGIGAQLRTEGEYTEVVRIVPGGPADLDGRLQPGDRIISVAQGDGEPEDVIDLRIDRVVRLIRGKKGTEVRLTIIPVDATDQANTSEIDIIRDQVELTESDADSQVLTIGDETIGVIDVPSFYIDSMARAQGDPNYSSVSHDVRRLLGELSEQEIDGLILDLRGNGGGSLSEAVDLAGLFITRGPIVQVRDREGRKEVLKDPDAKQVYDGPLVVLTDALSASASEIVAGAIQDYGRGIVVGAQTTHGKGTVQQVVDLDMFIEQMTGNSTTDQRAGALKITTQKFYRISGGSTQNRGVLSDIVLPSPWDGLDVYESDLDNALPWDEIEPARFSVVGDTSSVLDTLRTDSAARVASSEEFQTLLSDLAEREELSERKTISLNLDERRQEAESEPEDEEESSEREDFILQEAAQILDDWIEMTN